MAVEVEYGSGNKYYLIWYKLIIIYKKGALEGDMGIDTFYIGDIEVKDVEFMEITE